MALKLNDEKSRLQVAEHALNELSRLMTEENSQWLRQHILVRGVWLTIPEIDALVRGGELAGTQPNDAWGDAR